MRRLFTKANMEWAVDVWSRFRGNRMARNAGLLILAAIAALSNAVQIILIGTFALLGQKIVLPDTPSWLVVFLVAAAVILLVVDRAAPLAGIAPNKHDVELYKRFNEIFPDHLKAALRDHSFGDDWPVHRYDPLFTFESDWRGARHRFQDKDLDKDLTLVKNKCRQLVEKLAVYAGMAIGGVPRMTVKTEIDRMYGMRKETWDRITELNDIANELYSAIDAVDDLSRRKGL